MAYLLSTDVSEHVTFVHPTTQYVRSHPVHGSIFFTTLCICRVHPAADECSRCPGCERYPEVDRVHDLDVHRRPRAVRDDNLPRVADQALQNLDDARERRRQQPRCEHPR